MSHIAFVTTELAPHVGGGAGVLINELRARLIASGHRVSIVLATRDPGGIDEPGVVLAHGEDAAGWDLEFMAVSKAAAEALSEVHRSDPVDLVEIQDFDGLAFWTLTHRGDLGLGSVPIAVRFHGPVDLQIEAMAVSSPEWEAVAAMERESYAMADRVVVPSEGIRVLVLDRYSVDASRVVIGSPPVRSLSEGQTWKGGPSFLVIGRLGEVKGSHDMVDASIPILTEHPEVRLVFAGADGWSASSNRPMREWLDDRIPPGIRDQIEFSGPLDREDLATAIAMCRAVVVPSRFESFNLAAHEARMLGAPIVVPSLPAFVGSFGEATGGHVYDGTVAGLTDALRFFVDHPKEAALLAGQRGPTLGDPLAPYGNPRAEPWHPRSQGGLATAALARVEEAWLVPRRAAPPDSIGRRLLRRLPDGVFRTAKRIVPNTIKDGLRTKTDWGVEADRRRWEERFDRAATRVDANARSHPDPSVSIVIPCFNQGSFIRETLLSIFEQTDEDFEVIVVDDGSDDETTTPMLASLNLPNVTVIHQENRGLSGARNRGIAASRAEYVVTLDADDLLAPTFLTSLRKAIGDDPNVAFAHCWAELFGDTHMIWATRPFNPYQLMLSNSVVGCVLMRRSAWDAVGGYDESMRAGNEDWDLWIRLTAAGYRSVQVREPLFRYRKHGVSMSVETESRYEDALRDRTDRHPELYRRERLLGLKSEAYPLLCMIIDRPDQNGVPSLSDAHVITTNGEPLDGVVAGIRAKFAVRLPEDSSVSADALLAMCSYLESHENTGGVRSESHQALTVVRTWSLFDPDAPTAVDVMDLDASSSECLTPGMFPNPEWVVSAAIDGVPVLRQRPEEAGFLPDWVPS